MMLYAWYQVALRTGLLWRTTTNSQTDAPLAGWRGSIDTKLVAVPSARDLLAALGERLPVLISAADEIVNGRIRCFGGPPIALDLAPPAPLLHWTSYELGKAPIKGCDIKLIWEPARFGWAVTLAQAYLVSGDVRYVAAFWQYTSDFLDANPAYLGPNWVSAQEAALRLICFAVASQVFSGAPSTTPDQLERLALAIGEHAARIPPSLAYARSQNNNHLLAEAAGLYTAGRILPEHPQAASWRAAGIRWFNRALEDQIASDGTYIQHSTNYHRLMLQLALWMHCIGFPFSSVALGKLSEATDWLESLVHPGSGAAPNLGPNDGAYILPLTSSPFPDFRPVLQAASLAFRQLPALASGPWNDMSLWLAKEAKQIAAGSEPMLPRNSSAPQATIHTSQAPHILRSPGHASWAYLRAARFAGRPGHADQLHLDLWMGEINVALDAGTFSYNDPPPWDNALSSTAVHNTLTVEGVDQMLRAGRFLWLDWAQARVLQTETSIEGSLERILAQHDGYRRFGILHRREVIARTGGRWLITDQLLPASSTRFGPPGGPWNTLTCRLHWLLPDLSWQLLANHNGSAEIEFSAPPGPIRLSLLADPAGSEAPILQIVRAGKQVYGEGKPDPIWGWFSPTYQFREPALSVAFSILGKPPISLISEWALP